MDEQSIRLFYENEGHQQFTAKLKIESHDLTVWESGETERCKKTGEAFLHRA